LNSESSSTLLIVGYGNTLRRDDGVGPKAAEAIATLDLPGVRVLSLPLLTPEIADPISKSKTVVFVDAAIDAPREVQLRKIVPAESSQIMAHAANPATLLAVARDLFDHAPNAWLLTIPIEDMGIGETLSPLAQSGLAAAIYLLKNLEAEKMS
jgi:hydrogenase maturation protease